MPRLPSDRFPSFAIAALVLCLAAAGCGAGGDPEGANPASEVQQQAQESSGGGDVRAEGGDGADGKNGEKGEDGESVRAEGGSSSQSSSVTQTQSGSGDQSSSIVQRSGSGSTSSSSSSGPGMKTFSGSGATTLSFNVEEPSRLAWTSSDGRSFSARGDGFAIDSSAGRGEISLEPGRYDEVRVRGSSWTIVVRPR
jgi:hypothetical protein